MIPTATVNDAPPQLSGVSRFILNAALISKLGNQVLYIAMPIILLRTTGSIDTALLGFSLQTLPYVFSPVLGVLIDRYEPLRMFTIGEAFQLACITVLAFTFRHSIPLALVLLFASSVAAVASSILTSFVLIPSFVSPKALPRVNSYFTGGSQLIGVIGFPLGGLVIAFLGAQTAILADAATFALTITAGLIAPRDALPGRTQAPPLTAIAEGWRFVRADQSMLRLGLALGFTNLGAGCLAVLVLAQAQRAWGWHTSAVGFAMGIDALGAAAGALAGGRRAGQTNLVPGMVITCVGAVLMIPFGADPFLLVGLFIMSFGVGLLNVRSITFRQMRIPGELRGRVNSMLRMLIMGAIPLSAVIQLTMAGLPIWIRLAVPALCARRRSGDLAAQSTVRPARRLRNFMEDRLKDKPFFFSLEGADGSGKTTTLNMLRDTGVYFDRPVLFLEKKSNVPANDYPSTHLAGLRNLIWNHPRDAPVHLLSEMHWMHLQAAWFHAMSYSRIRPALAADTTVFADGWYYKLLARVALAPSLDYDRVAGLYDGVIEPDFVILLDADPELTSTRKNTFTEIEGGNLQGNMKVSRQTFQDHQRALRKNLLEMAGLRGWYVLPVAEQSREQVCAQVLEVLAEWKRGRSETLQPPL